MEIVIDCIPLIKLFLIFSIIVFLQKSIMPVGPAFLSGVIILQLWFPLPLKKFFAKTLACFSSVQTISLTLVVVLIVSLSHSLKVSGHFDKIVNSLRQYVSSRRTSVFILPALIGLLPMPGGAIFSAPMVEEISDTSMLSPAQQAASNHWFRHVWEYIWPLYPAILLTVQITGIGLIVFITANIPFTVAAIVLGFLLIARKKHFTSTTSSVSSGGSAAELAHALFPILIVIISFIVFQLFSSAAAALFFRYIYPAISTLPGHSVIGFSAPSYIEKSLLIPSILMGIAFTVAEYPEVGIKKVFTDKRIPSLVAMIVGLLLFQEILRSGTAVPELMNVFTRWSIPLWALAVLLPFITGLVTGISVGFVACSFPIIAEAVVCTGNTDSMLPFIALSYVCGFMGVIISPLHVCLLLTAKHFEVSLAGVIKQMIIPVIIMLLTGGGMFVLLRLVF